MVQTFLARYGVIQPLLSTWQTARAQRRRLAIGSHTAWARLILLGILQQYGELEEDSGHIFTMIILSFAEDSDNFVCLRLFTQNSPLVAVREYLFPAF